MQNIEYMDIIFLLCDFFMGFTATSAGYKYSTNYQIIFIITSRQDHFSIKMTPCTRKTCYANACTKSDTIPRSCGHSASRRVKAAQIHPDISSKYRHPSPTDFEQPKTILRMRIHQGRRGPHMSLVTGPFNISDMKSPVSEAEKRKPISEAYNDRASWIRRLRPKPHRCAELAGSCVSNTRDDMEL